MKPLLTILMSVLLWSFVPAYAQSKKVSLKNGVNYATVNQVKHWYRIAGAEHKTTPIVVIHGGPGGNHYVFERTAGKELEKKFTVIYYEQRGCGRSDAPASDTAYSIPLLVSDLELLRHHWGIPAFIPLGYSFGGLVAAEYALAHPDHTKGLILQSFATLDDNAVVIEQIAHFYAIGDQAFRHKIDSLLALNKSMVETNLLIWNESNQPLVKRFLCRDTEKANQMFAMWKESGLRNTGKMMKALVAKPSKRNIYDDLNQIKVPVLLLAGLYDRNGALLSSLKVKDVLPGSELILFENSGHFPDLEETGKYYNSIVKWHKASF